MAWVPKVNRHVAFLLQETVGGETNYVKRRPAIITDFALDSNPVLRVLHSGEVYGNAAVGIRRKTDPDDNNVSYYVSY